MSLSGLQERTELVFLIILCELNLFLRYVWSCAGNGAEYELETDDEGTAWTWFFESSLRSTWGLTMAVGWSYIFTCSVCTQEATGLLSCYGISDYIGMHKNCWTGPPRFCCHVSGGLCALLNRRVIKTWDHISGLWKGATCYRESLHMLSRDDGVSWRNLAEPARCMQKKASWYVQIEPWRRQRFSSGIKKLFVRKMMSRVEPLQVETIFTSEYIAHSDIVKGQRSN